jgi:hypothetical protein
VAIQVSAHFTRNFIISSPHRAGRNEDGILKVHRLRQKKVNLRGIATLKFIFILGWFVGLITLYIIHGKHLISTFIDKVERVGKRHDMPYSYTYYKSRRTRGDRKKTLQMVLTWAAVALLILGLLAMFGVFD